MIELSGISLGAGDFQLEGIDLTVEPGEYAVLMGRTGCGKTTLLEGLCGLLRFQSGRAMIDGLDVTRLRPADRGIGYVPQDGALFPSFTVRRHLTFGPRLHGATAQEANERAANLARALGIEDLLDRKPGGLSGGERQRVALGRALAARPKVLLLDEPLSALDEETWDSLCTLLATLCSSMNVTVLHVTHSRAEAKRLADVCFLLEGGRLIRE